MKGKASHCRLRFCQIQAECVCSKSLRQSLVHVGLEMLSLLLYMQLVYHLQLLFFLLWTPRPTGVEFNQLAYLKHRPARWSVSLFFISMYWSDWVNLSIMINWLPYPCSSSGVSCSTPQSVSVETTGIPAIHRWYSGLSNFRRMEPSVSASAFLFWEHLGGVFFLCLPRH